MKLYVIPIEKACDANCLICITKYKKGQAFGSKLDISNLSKLDSLDIDKIEITGGGETFLHPQIETIMERCLEKAPTQIYTDGVSLDKYLDSAVLPKLSYLCLSQMHYDQEKNLKLMKANASVSLRQLCHKGISVKLSLVLCRSGISTAQEVCNYLEWANANGAKKVVIRQMFDYDPSETKEEYEKLLAMEYVSSESIFWDLHIDHYHPDGQGNPIFNWKNLEVEVEYRSCACEINSPALRADGQIYLGWSNRLWHDRRKEEE